MVYSPVSRGFTLIELLVVIAIIGTLATVVLASLNSARTKAANAQILSQVGQYITALELYYSDNGSYPPFNSAWVCLGNYSDGTCWNGSYSNNSTLISMLTPYIPGMPGDGIEPYSGAEGFLYQCASNCAGYYITWFVAGDGVDDSCGPGKLHTAYAPNGTRCWVIR